MCSCVCVCILPPIQSRSQSIRPVFTISLPSYLWHTCCCNCLLLLLLLYPYANKNQPARHGLLPSKLGSISHRIRHWYPAQASGPALPACQAISHSCNGPGSAASSSSSNHGVGSNYFSLLRTFGAPFILISLGQRFVPPALHPLKERQLACCICVYMYHTRL